MIDHHMGFVSVMLCVSGALLRKMLVVRRISQEYILSEIVEKLSSREVMGVVVGELFETVRSIYFPVGSSQGTTQELIHEELASKLRR